MQFRICRRRLWDGGGGAQSVCLTISLSRLSTPNGVFDCVQCIARIIYCAIQVPMKNTHAIMRHDKNFSGIFCFSSTHICFFRLHFHQLFAFLIVFLYCLAFFSFSLSSQRNSRNVFTLCYASRFNFSAALNKEIYKWNHAGELARMSVSIVQVGDCLEKDETRHACHTRFLLYLFGWCCGSRDHFSSQLLAKIHVSPLFAVNRSSFASMSFGCFLFWFRCHMEFRHWMHTNVTSAAPPDECKNKIRMLLNKWITPPFLILLYSQPSWWFTTNVGFNWCQWST